METKELEKSKVHITVEIIEYLPNSVVSKTILKKIDRKHQRHVV